MPARSGSRPMFLTALAVVVGVSVITDPIFKGSRHRVDGRARSRRSSSAAWPCRCFISWQINHRAPAHDQRRLLNRRTPSS